MADIVARFRVVGSDRMRAALRGMTDEQRKAQRIARDEQRKTTRDAEKAAKDQQRAVGQALRDSFRTLRDIEQEKRREQEKTTRDALKNTEAQKRAVGQAMREAFRDLRRFNQEQEKAARGAQGSGRQRLGMAMGAAGIGIGIASSAISRAQSALGIESPDAVYQRGQQARLGFLRQSVAMGQTREQRAALESSILQTSRDTMVDPGQLYEAASTSAERFSDMDAFAKHLGDLARISQATGASMQDLEGTAGELKRQFNLADGAVGEMMYSIVSSGALGSMGPADFASSFSQSMGQYVATRGARGHDTAAASDFIATAQVLASGGVGGDVAKTRMENMMNSLTNSKQQQRLRAAGVDVMNRDRRGRTTGMKSFAEIAQMLSTARGTAGTDLSGVVTDAQARQGLLSLMHAEGTGQSVSAISLANAEQGRGIVGNVMGAIRSDSVGNDLAAQSARVVGVFSQIGSMSESFHKVSDGVTELGTQFPILGGMAGDLAGALSSAAQAALGFSAMQGVTGAVGAAGAGAAGATLSAGSVLGVGAAAVGGWGVGRMIANATGSDDAIGGWLNSTFGRDQSQDAPGAWEAQARASRGGRGGGTQPVTGTVELGPNTVSRIVSGQQPAPGQGRRGDGGPAGRQ